MDRPTLGRAEQVDFPDFNLSNLTAKVDTGAYTSSIDCEYVKEIQKNGKTVIEFVLLRPGKPGYTGEKLYAEDFLPAEIKSANGVQVRYTLITKAVVGGKTFDIRFSLSNRSNMRYSVLIGRKLIAQGNFLIDVTKGDGPPDDEEERGL